MRSQMLTGTRLMSLIRIIIGVRIGRISPIGNYGYSVVTWVKNQV